MTWGDGVMALFTAVSVVAAVLALGHARRATGAAAKAALEAAEANRIAKEANKIATDSNTIAERAAQDARDAPTAIAWDEFVVAITALQTFDPAGTDGQVAPLLTTLRQRATLLVDKLPWDHFDKWLSAEQTAGVLLMQEASEKGQREQQRLGRRLTPYELVEIDRPFHLWVAAYTTNVRMARREGPAGVPFRMLTDEARKSIKATCDRNGWEVPPERIPGVEPIEP